jgi:transposase
VEDWALIRRLVADGVPQRQVARQLGVARGTVAKAVASSGPPRYERAVVENAFTPFEPLVVALLAEYPDLPGTVIAERVGWTGSITWFRDNVRRLRPRYRPVDPADRISYTPGDQAQCDLWFPPARVPLGDGTHGSPPVLVIVASYSRFVTARMLPSRTTADLLAGMWVLLSRQLGAVPRRLVWDNEAGIGRGNRLADGVPAFAGVLATRIQQLKPFDPESKGIVERVNGFLETSFLPGRVFTGPDDFNVQLGHWLTIANQRTVRALKSRPVDLVDADRTAMLPLPPIAPPVGGSFQVRLGRDYYVRVAGNDYSVDPSVIGRLVDVHAGLETVQVTVDGSVVGSHLRCWGRQATITDPAHVATAKTLRTLFQQPRPTADPGDQGHDDDLVRDLGDYDRAFGVDLPEPAGPVEQRLDDGEVA